MDRIIRGVQNRRVYIPEKSGIFYFLFFVSSRVGCKVLSNRMVAIMSSSRFVPIALLYLAFRGKKPRQRTRRKGLIARDYQNLVAIETEVNDVCVCFAPQNLSMPLQIVLRLDGIFAPKSMCRTNTDLQCIPPKKVEQICHEKRGIVIDRRRWGSEVLVKVTSPCLRQGKVTAV